jgi:anti-sigma factor RsiW
MSKTRFRQTDLEGYLDEALAPERMTEIEDALRHDPALADRLATINARRDAGVHSLGEIWRRHRLTCPSREQLGSYLLGVLPEDAAAYIAFHLETIGCRPCQASAADLKAQHHEGADAAEHRRRRYFQSSAGYLKKGK